MGEERPVHVESHVAERSLEEVPQHAGREFAVDALASEHVLAAGMLRHFFQGTLGYVGLDVHRPFFAHHVPYVDTARRAAMLEELRDYVRTLDAQPLISMPDLDAFDDALAPRGANAS